MLSVISYNVMFNDILLEQRHQILIKLIITNRADVICLQEVRAELVGWFISQLKSYYKPASHVLLPKERLYGELVFVKNDIIINKLSIIPLPGKMGRALQHLELDHKDVNYNIVTFHLESMNCKKIRRQQLDIMWKHVDGLDNVICCGDTNQTIKENPQVPDCFFDAWEQTDGKVGRYTYYSNRFWNRDRKQRYDKVWFSNDLQLQGFGVLGDKPIADQLWISDHDGLYCLFS